MEYPVLILETFEKQQLSLQFDILQCPGISCSNSRNFRKKARRGLIHAFCMIVQTGTRRWVCLKMLNHHLEFRVHLDVQSIVTARI